MSLPFKRKEIVLVPDEDITGSVMEGLLQEFKATGTMPCGFETLLDFWKDGTLRMAGIYETQELFDFSREDPEWAMKMFVKPGAPYSIFFAVSVDDVVWISPNTPKRVATWIKNVF